MKWKLGCILGTILGSPYLGKLPCWVIDSIRRFLEGCRAVCPMFMLLCNLPLLALCLIARADVSAQLKTKNVRERTISAIPQTSHVCTPPKNFSLPRPHVDSNISHGYHQQGAVDNMAQPSCRKEICNNDFGHPKFLACCFLWVAEELK